MVQLHEVYGIRTSIPTHTYVDRAGWDQKFAYLLGTERHVVVHGVSKQGKSCLRRKALPEDNSIVIQCLPQMSVNQILESCLRAIEAKLPGATQSENSLADKTTLEFFGEISKLIAKFSAKVAQETQSTSKDTVSTAAVSGYQEDINFIAKVLHSCGKRLIFEDFHYLSEDVRKQMAFHLKAFYEKGIYVVIVGIWAEQNLLTYYNNDLSGRIEEVDLKWSEDELRQVLRKGYDPLNIVFSVEIERAIIQASFGNVGITQRIAERLCFVEGVLATQSKRRIVSSVDSLQSALDDIVQSLHQRYAKIYEVFCRGFQEDTELKLYKNIFRLVTEATDIELINGVGRAEILYRLQNFEPRVRAGDMDAALSRVERLQAQREVAPNFVCYHAGLRSLSLSDREFLFYRRYGKPSWDLIGPG